MCRRPVYADAGGDGPGRVSISIHCKDFGSIGEVSSDIVVQRKIPADGQLSSRLRLTEERVYSIAHLDLVNGQDAYNLGAYPSCPSTRYCAFLSRSTGVCTVSDPSSLVRTTAYAPLQNLSWDFGVRTPQSTKYVPWRATIRWIHFSIFIYRVKSGVTKSKRSSQLCHSAIISTNNQIHNLRYVGTAYGGSPGRWRA